MDANTLDVIHDENAQRFYIRLDERHSAEINYRRSGDTLNMYHTGVPPAYEGRGIASRLAQVALDYARENGLKVIPSCSFISVYIRRHPEYAELVG